MPDFNSTHIVSAQGSIRSTENFLKLNAIPNAGPTRDNTVVALGETQFMLLKYLLSFKLYIAFNIYLYVS